MDRGKGQVCPFACCLFPLPAFLPVSGRGDGLSPFARDAGCPRRLPLVGRGCRICRERTFCRKGVLFLPLPPRDISGDCLEARKAAPDRISAGNPAALRDPRSGAGLGSIGNFHCPGAPRPLCRLRQGGSPASPAGSRRGGSPLFRAFWRPGESTGPFPMSPGSPLFRNSSGVLPHSSSCWRCGPSAGDALSAATCVLWEHSWGCSQRHLSFQCGSRVTGAPGAGCASGTVPRTASR